MIRFDFYKNNNVEVLLNNITNSLNLYFMKKIIFSGKGYKIKKSYKNKNNLDKFFVFYFNKYTTHFKKLNSSIATSQQIVTNLSFKPIIINSERKPN